MEVNTFDEYVNDLDEEPLPETYWIIDHDELCWAPGVLIKDVSDTQMHV